MQIIDTLNGLTFVKSKYISHNHIGALLNVASNRTSPFWQELRAYFPIINTLSSFTLNNGEKIFFWENKWTNNTALKYTLPNLYYISTNKKCTVETMLMKYSINHLAIFNNNSIGSFNSTQFSSQLHEFIISWSP